MVKDGPTQICVAIVHGYPAMRTGLRVLLEKQGGLAVAVEADHTERLEDLFPENGPVQVALVQLRAPYAAVRDMVLWLVRKRAIPVITVGELTERVADEMLAIGVRGLLPPDVGADELKRSCTVASAGGYHANAWFNGRPRQGKAKGRPTTHADEVTAKQLVVLRGFHAGLTIKEIVEQTGIGVRGIQSHRDALFLKFNVNRRALLLKEANIRGLV